MKVIGIAGTNGAGKDTIADYVVNKHGYKRFTVSDVIKARMRADGITEITREKSGEYQKKFVDQHGIDYWMKEMIKEIKAQDNDKIVVAGLRYPSDIDTLRNEFKENFISVLVDADPQVRFDRISSRGREDAPKTLEQFKEEEEYERKMFHFDETFKRIDVTIDNGGLLEASYKQTEEKLGEKFL